MKPHGHWLQSQKVSGLALYNDKSSGFASDD
jgi:hypothetical protein